MGSACLAILFILGVVMLLPFAKVKRYDDDRDDSDLTEEEVDFINGAQDEY